MNELQDSYFEGDEITVQLPTITEHYYTLTVNGIEAQLDRINSSIEYTYFTFIMPNEDAIIEIEEHSVDIPEAP